MKRSRGKAVVLALVALCSSGCSATRHESTAATTTVRHTSASTPLPAIGTLAGTMHAAGGPYPGTDRIVSGPIFIVGADGRRWSEQAAVAHGFSVRLPAGRYSVTGGGTHGTIECYGPSAARVVRARTTHVQVTCDLD